MHPHQPPHRSRPSEAPAALPAQAPAACAFIAPSPVRSQHDAARRHDEILRLPPEARRQPLLQLLADLDQLPGADKVCMHNEIAIATLSLSDADAEALHTPLMRMLQSAHQSLGRDAREDVAQAFADILLLSAAPRDDSFNVRLAGRLIHLAQTMEADRLTAKCVDKIINALQTRHEERRAHLIGQAAPAAPGLMPEARLGFLAQLYEAMPRDADYRLACLLAIGQQLDSLPSHAASRDFRRTVLQEKYQLLMDAAETELTLDRLAASRLDKDPVGSNV